MSLSEGKQGEEGMLVAEICRKAGISQANYISLREVIRMIEKAEAMEGRPWLH